MGVRQAEAVVAGAEGADLEEVGLVEARPSAQDPAAGAGPVAAFRPGS